MSDQAFAQLIKRYQLRRADLTNQISDTHLVEISLSHCQKWKFLPSFLDIESIVAQDIDTERISEEDKRRAFFLKWKDLKGSDATYERLIIALLRIKCKDDAESVCKLMKGSGSIVLSGPPVPGSIWCVRSLCLGVGCCLLACFIGVYVVDGNSWTGNVLSEYTGGNADIPKKEESFHPDVTKSSTPKASTPKPDAPKPSAPKPKVPKPSTNTKTVPPPQREAQESLNVASQRKPSRLSLPDPSNCHTTGKGMKEAMVGEKTTAILQAFNLEGKPHKEVIGSLECKIVSQITGTSVSCSVERKEQNQYEISYRPVSKGKHHLSITIGGHHVRASPFSVSVKSPIEKLGPPIQTIYSVKSPWGVALTLNGEVVISETEGHISVFSPGGEKLQSFGTHGSGQGQFENPSGLAVDDQGNILVADFNNHRIQKFTAEGRFLVAVGSEGSSPLQFDKPSDIVSCNDKVYVLDWGNSHIQVLDYDLTFARIFGSQGTGQGQFSSPRGIACDSAGKLYVADSNNHRIQVFTHNGGFVRSFGTHGKGKGELDHPVSVAVDSGGVVYVSEVFNYRISIFTSEGQFVTSFGKRGKGPGELNFSVGIAVDSSGAVYVCDWNNDRLQVF